MTACVINLTVLPLPEILPKQGVKAWNCDWCACNTERHLISYLA